MLISLLTKNSGYASSDVWGYGATLDEAQTATLQIAQDSAASKNTCVGGISNCSKDSGLYKCDDWVADYKKSCKNDARDFKKVVNYARQLLRF